MAEHHNPLAQFEVHTLIPLPQVAGHNIDFTNASLFMVLALVVSSLFLGAGMRRAALVPGRWQGLVEMYYEFVEGLVLDNIGPKGKAFFPFVFTVFTFLLFSNMLGMWPIHGFTITSHIAVTFAMAIVIFIGATFIGFARHGLHFFHMFLPAGTPLALAPLLIVIELLSFLARPITLSLRLAGNMMAGHVLLKVVAGFVAPMMFFGVLPLALLTAFMGFEFFVAGLQAYVFTLLVCVYLNDSVNMH